MKQNRVLQFNRRLEELIGKSEVEAFHEAIKKVSPKSVRYNRNLCQLEELRGTPVPWCESYGRYWDGDVFPSRTIEYVAGKYYIQEASAMLPVSAASRVIDFSDKVVLDLTAAPGGKTTQVAELIGSGYLVANEVIRKRVDALTWNVNRHRLNNVIIVSLETSELANSLPGFFDVVMVDAPCSGEGMFQRKKHSLEQWSERNVRFCARRQESILKDAAELLSPGGFLVYSTCTFAKEENEGQVEFLLNKGFSPVELPDHDHLPISPAVSEKDSVLSCSRRIFPHRQGGAGAFISVLQKGDDEPGSNGEKYVQYRSKKFQVDGKKYPFLDLTDVKGHFFEKNGVVSLFSHEKIPEFLWTNALQFGAPVIDTYRSPACMYGSVQIPAPAALIQVNEEQAELYCRGEELSMNHGDGDCFIRHKDMCLGPVKVAQGKARNKLPKPLRKF
jgi:16S rRNA C967 or C1407 C5-methylase (RsmB/RsmF family)